MRDGPRLTELDRLLATDPETAALLTAVRAQRALAATVAEHLPPELAHHLRGAVLRGDELVLLTDGGAWATRLRFLEPALRQVLAARNQVTVRRLSTRVSLAPPSSAAPPAPPALSDHARAALESAAEAAATPALAAALRRLARR